MAALLIVIGWQALLGISMAVFDFKHYGLNGLVAIALWLAAALIYWRWFQGWLWHFALSDLWPARVIGGCSVALASLNGLTAFLSLIAGLPSGDS
jgi:hypothetical protein